MFHTCTVVYKHSSQGWALRCLFVCTLCVQCVGSGFPSLAVTTSATLCTCTCVCSVRAIHMSRGTVFTSEYCPPSIACIFMYIHCTIMCILLPRHFFLPAHVHMCVCSYRLSISYSWAHPQLYTHTVHIYTCTVHLCLGDSSQTAATCTCIYTM